ncbi:MAG: NfeD family protein [Peptoniphilaceae bacterium]|nr:NfeD family protein [Peptoniphilaceae bacterium]MDY6018381.1 NfeD family protein [Anaerococcus sp.]
MANDLILAVSFTLAFICLVALIFTEKKILFAILSLGFFIFFYRSNLISGRADLTTVLIFISGVLLLTLELFIPSFGIIGIVGAILTGYSIFDAFDNSLTSFIVLLTTAAAVLISVTVFVRLGFKAKVFDKAILENGQTKERGYNSKKDYSNLVGKIGFTKTILRPTGVIVFDGTSYDAKTKGDFIKKDKKVIVREIKDGHIIVEEIKED